MSDTSVCIFVVLTAVEEGGCCEMCERKKYAHCVFVSGDIVRMLAL